jgi:hypothetical protein
MPQSQSAPRFAPLRPTQPRSLPIPSTVSNPLRFNDSAAPTHRTFNNNIVARPVATNSSAFSNQASARTAFGSQAVRQNGRQVVENLERGVDEYFGKDDTDFEAALEDAELDRTFSLPEAQNRCI